MSVGSKRTLSKFKDFDFALEGGKTDCVSSLNTSEL